jgi:hypothetical protein
MVINSETWMATYSKSVLTGLAAVILIALMFSYFCPDSQAQTRTNFTSSDQFSIPEFNGNIRFALNGSYASATLKNGTWIFVDVSLNNSQLLGNLSVSAQNSNMTIFSYRSSTFFGRSPLLRYAAEGVGTQTVNLGLNSTQPTHPNEWYIIAPGNTYVAQGKGWNLLPDNTVVLTGIVGNISVTHFGFVIPNDSHLPFYQQHSIIILTGVVLALVIAISVMIKFKVRR